jgi:KAP family P-loop domain
VGENDGESTLGRRFLEKIVQIPFVIPRADLPTFTTFVSRSLEAGGQIEDMPVEESSEQRSAEAEERIEQQREQGKSWEEAAETVQGESDHSEKVVSDAIREVSAQEFVRNFEDSEEVRRAVADAIPYLAYNPRKVKRFINLLKLQGLIAKRRGLLDAGIIRIEPLAKWLIIAMRWPAAIEAIMSEEGFQERLLQAYDSQKELPNVDDRSDQAQAVRATLALLLEDSPTRQLYKADELIRLLRAMDGSVRDASPYIHLTSTTTS